MTRSFEIWAPPVRWGPSVELAILAGGPYRVSLTAETKSNAPSSFDGELAYFDENGAQRTDRFLGPGSIAVKTEAGVWQQPSVRFRSHSVGQIVYVRYSVAALTSGLRQLTEEAGLLGAREGGTGWFDQTGGS